MAEGGGGNGGRMGEGVGAQASVLFQKTREAVSPGGLYNRSSKS